MRESIVFGSQNSLARMCRNSIFDSTSVLNSYSLVHLANGKRWFLLFVFENLIFGVPAPIILIS